MWKVISTPTTVSSTDGRASTPSGRLNSARPSRSITCTPPCSAPHARKVSAAPCHRPPSTMVMNTLMQLANSPLRPPPSGTYR